MSEVEDLKKRVSDLERQLSKVVTIIERVADQFDQQNEINRSLLELSRKDLTRRIG